MSRAALRLALCASLVATSLASGPASLRGRSVVSEAEAAEPSVDAANQPAPTPAPAPSQSHHSPAMVAAMALRPKYQRVGCFRRAEGDEDDEHVYMDKTCVHAPRDDPSRHCRSGLPFFRKTMEDGQSFLDCAAFCLSKGLDISGVVTNPAGDVSMECRCGATTGNAPAWHQRTPPVGLLLPPRSSAVKEQDPTCAVLVSRYVGQMDGGMVPYRFLQLGLDDTAYLDEVAEGMDHVTEEDDDPRERLDGRYANHDLTAKVDPDTVLLPSRPRSAPDAPAFAGVAGGLCGDAALSGLTSGRGRQLTCPESEQYCGQFSVVAQSCPLTCGSCDTDGDWLSCYPNRCSAGGGAWLTKSDSDGLVYVNYFFANGLDQERREAFELAAMEFEERTCIRLVENSQTPRIQVDVFDTGSCFASLGFPGVSGTGQINLGWCNSRRHVGSIIHEIGHTIGMNHEQKRSDAQASIDTPAGEKGPYLIMFWNNIDEEWKSEYLPDSASYIGSETAGYADYDYASIMHYGRGSPGRGSNVYAFETVNPVFNSVVGSRSELSTNDVDQILDMYQCSAPGSSPNPAPTRAPTPAPTRSPSPVSGSCPSTCSSQTCDFWVQRRGFSCQQLTGVFGCDCTGCSLCASGATQAPTPAPTRPPTPARTPSPTPSPTPAPNPAPTPSPPPATGACPSTCGSFRGFSRNCNFWVQRGWSCQQLTGFYSCDCGGCSRCA